MFTLSYTEHGVARRHRLLPGVTLIGRSPECDLLIDDTSISRRHAEFTLTDTACQVRDLGSRNGTYQNGLVVAQATLTEGDTLTLGQVPVQVSRRRLTLTSDPFTLDQDSTLCRPVAELGAPDAGGSGVDAPRLLTLLSALGGLLIETHTLEDLLDRVADLVFEALPADRCYLLLGKADDLPIPRVVRQRNGKPPADAVISRTIVDRVRQDRVAMLAANAQVDPRLPAGESIRAQDIRAFMCAPLWNQTEVIGVLYADSPEVGRFAAADLELFTALANSAAVLIERARLAARVMEETRRRERLQRYHSPAVIDRILSASQAGEGTFLAQEREVSVLFADLVSFSARAERLPPNDVALLLNGCLGAMSEAVFEQDGMLDKFMGDALLAVFGAPLDQPDHARRAVRAAIGIRQRLAAANQERGDEPLAVRIAINSGVVMAGDIGSPKRREYTVLGDVVNTASRLQSQVAGAGEILISRATYDHIRDEVTAQAHGPVTLRGRSTPVEVFQL